MWEWLFNDEIWWYLGPMTFLPFLLTGEIDWRTSAASALLPSLMAHLIYGATTAIAFLLLETRHTHRLLRNPRTAAHEVRRVRRWELRGVLCGFLRWAWACYFPFCSASPSRSMSGSSQWKLHKAENLGKIPPNKQR